MANNPKNENADTTDAPFIKEVICNAVYGKVKWFNVKRGYGFVCRNDNQEDVFIHQSAIVKSNPDHPRRSVGEGEEIQFDIVKGSKGNEAANVCGADGNHVKGSEYALRFMRSRGRGRGYRGRGGRGGRSRDTSGEFESHPSEVVRGSIPHDRGFRGGGRPYVVQYRRPYQNYDMPPPPPQYYYDNYYDYDYFRGPSRGRGGFRGGRIFRGGLPPREMPMNFPPPREMPMNFPPYEHDFERRPRGGRGRSRFRGGRGRGWFGRGRGGSRGRGSYEDQGEEHQEENPEDVHHE